MLSDLFVAPDHQGFGLGRELLGRLWPPQQPQPRFTFSSRHPSALPVYARAGLHPGWPLLYLTGPLPAATTVTARLVEAVAAAEAETGLVGTDRAPDYLFWRRIPDTSGLLVYDGPRLAACGAVRPGAVVHLCCPSPSDAQPALCAALAAAGGRTVTAQIPGPHPAVPDLLRAGFRITDYDISMSTPGLDLPTGWAYSPGLG
jgi:GNAT superfamily N-acetyltransferase